MECAELKASLPKEGNGCADHITIVCNNFSASETDVDTTVVSTLCQERLLPPGIPSFVPCMCADLGERRDLAVELAIDGENLKRQY